MGEAYIRAPAHVTYVLFWTTISLSSLMHPVMPGRNFHNITKIIISKNSLKLAFVIISIRKLGNSWATNVLSPPIYSTRKWFFGIFVCLIFLSVSHLFYSKLFRAVTAVYFLCTVFAVVELCFNNWYDLTLLQQVGRKKETAQAPVSDSRYLSADQLCYCAERTNSCKYRTQCGPGARSV